MKHAYLIIAHNEPNILKTLLPLIPQHYYKIFFFKYLSNKKLLRILPCQRIHLT